MCEISLTHRDDFPPDHGVTDGTTPLSARTSDAHKICHAYASSTLPSPKGCTAEECLLTAESISSLIVRGNLTSFGSSAVNTQSIGTRCAITLPSSTSRKNRVSR